MEKHLFILCFAVMLFAVMTTSCNQENVTAEEDLAVIETESKQEETSVKDIPDELPDMNYNGAVYTIMIVNENHRFTYRYDLDYEECTDSLDYASFNRTTAVEERFNVDVQVNTNGGGGGNEFTLLEQYAMAGENNAVDLVLPNGNGYGKAATAILNHLLMDWTTLDMVDFDKPWWDKNTIYNMALADHIYCASGSLTLTRGNQNAVLFNKDMMDTIGEKYPYDSVLAGTWTIDEMMSYAEKATIDLNGDGNFDETDQYGLLTNGSLMSNFMHYWGANNMMQVNSDGTLRLDFNEELLQNIADKIVEIMETGSIYLFNGSSQENKRMFSNGQGLFVQYNIGSAYGELRDIDGFDYGILPNPKRVESDEQYGCDRNPFIICMYGQVEDPERTGIITEALAAETLKQCYDPLVESVLHGKTARDPQDVQMIDLVWSPACVIPTLLFVYTPDSSVAYIMRDVAQTRSASIQSKIESMKTPLETQIKDFNDAYLAMLSEN